MENEFKKIGTKIPRCYYFVNCLLDENSNENILIYVFYKTLIGAKYLRIRCNKINGFIRVHDVTRYLALLCCEKHDTISDSIKNFRGLKSGIKCFFLHLSEDQN